jgi:4-carboxymuconolactone decarboxylase
MNNGLTKSKASEMLTHLLFCAGWPTIPVAKEVFEKRSK